MQQRFLLQNLLLAQHVSGTTIPIIRSSRVLYSGCCLWYFVLWFSSCWTVVELRVILFPHINLLKPNDIYIYICRTAALTSRRYILNIYSTNIHTEYFKHAA